MHNGSTLLCFLVSLVLCCPVPPRSAAAELVADNCWLGGWLCTHRRSGSDMVFPDESDMLVLVSICSGGALFLDIPGVDLSSVANGTDGQAHGH